MSATYPIDFVFCCCILFPLYFVVFKQTVCKLAAEANVEQVFSREGQLSEVNIDPDTLADMFSIMVNKLAYKPSVKDIMDKYYSKSSNLCIQDPKLSLNNDQLDPRSQVVLQLVT